MLNDILVLDTETSGLDYKTNALCSVTMKVCNKDIIKTWYVLPNNKLIYTDKAFEVNKLSLEILKEKGISEISLIGEITKFISENYNLKPAVLGQNVYFDLNFLNELFLRNNMQSFYSIIHHQTRDTIQLMNYFKDADLYTDSLELGKVYKYFLKKELTDAHSSEVDVLATEELYLFLLSKLKELKI